MEDCRFAHADGVRNVLESGPVESVRGKEAHGRDHGRSSDVFLGGSCCYHLARHALPYGKDARKRGIKSRQIAARSAP
jgi:hypothetical protein